MMRIPRFKNLKWVARIIRYLGNIIINKLKNDKSTKLLWQKKWLSYYIITNNSSGIQLEDNHLKNNSGVLSFTYNNETFSYDLSDSFIQELAGCGNYYWFDAMDGYERIIYNTQSEYLISINGNEGEDVIIINLKQPNEIIDYR